MNLRLYKPGQGYWMRVITAAFFGALVLAAAAWLWNEAQAVALPVRGYTIPVEGLPADALPAPGDAITLQADSTDPASPGRVTVSRGTIVSAERTTSGANFVTGKLASELGREPLDASHFLVTPAAGQPYTVRLYGAMQPIDLFPPIYLQAGLAGIIVVIGGAFLFYYIAVNPRSGEFLIATDGEMKKVNWSTRKEVVGSTWVVVTTCFLMAGALFVVDYCFRWLFELVGVFEKL